MPRRSFSSAERCLIRAPETPALCLHLLQQAQPRCICRRLCRRTRKDVCALSALYTCLLCLVSHVFILPLTHNQKVPRAKYLCCNRHRDASQHACPVPEPIAPPKNEAAHALLAKHFSSVSATSTSSSNKTVSASASGSAPTKRKIPTDLKKLAQFQRVEFMKMRHRAVPADPSDKPGSIGIDQRLHVRVSCESDPQAAQKIFWFRKVSIGHLAVFLSSLCFSDLRLWALGERLICLLAILTSRPLR